MKKIIKKLTVGIIVGCACLFNFTSTSEAQIIQLQPGNYQTATFGYIPAGLTNLVSGTSRVRQYVFSNTNATPGFVYLYDVPSSAGTNTTYTTGAYSNITYVYGLVTNYYTNSILSGTVALGGNPPTGVITTNTFYANSAVTNTIPANTNSYPLIAAFVLPASTNGGLYTISFDGQRYQQGIVMSNTLGISSTIISYATIGN